MSDVTQLIHHYLRHNKKFPHVFCPGCGHGIVLGSLVRSIHELGLPKDDVVLVAGIGCSGTHSGLRGLQYGAHHPWVVP